MVVRSKPKMILPEFLPFFLQSDMFMERAIEISVGSLSPTINWKTLKVQEFPLPPLDEQKRIAEILWAADDAEEGFSKSIEQHRFLIRKVGVTFYKESGYPKYRFSEHVEDSAYGPRFSNALYDINGGIGQIRTTDISDSGDIEYSTVPLANLDVSAWRVAWVEANWRNCSPTTLSSRSRLSSNACDSFW